MKEVLSLLFAIFLVLALSYGGTVFLVWLIFLLLGFEFSLRIATAVWLALWILGGLAG